MQIEMQNQTQTKTKPILTQACNKKSLAKNVWRCVLVCSVDWILELETLDYFRFYNLDISTQEKPDTRCLYKGGIRDVS